VSRGLTSSADEVQLDLVNYYWWGISSYLFNPRVPCTHWFNWLAFIASQIIHLLRCTRGHFMFFKSLCSTDCRANQNECRYKQACINPSDLATWRSVENVWPKREQSRTCLLGTYTCREFPSFCASLIEERNLYATNTVQNRRYYTFSRPGWRTHLSTNQWRYFIMDKQFATHLTLFPFGAPCNCLVHPSFAIAPIICAFL